MAWVKPKTDWHGSTNESGVYDGDRFDARDFNRIKNNLEYLKDLANTLYEEFSIGNLGADRGFDSDFYADEINQLETNLTTINKNTVKRQYGAVPFFAENGYTMDYNELNRLEGAILDLYDRLSNQREGRRTFTWNFGMKGGL